MYPPTKRYENPIEGNGNLAAAISRPGITIRDETPTQLNPYDREDYTAPTDTYLPELEDLEQDVDASEQKKIPSRPKPKPKGKGAPEESARSRSPRQVVRATARSLGDIDSSSRKSGLTIDGTAAKASPKKQSSHGEAPKKAKPEEKRVKPPPPTKKDSQNSLGSEKTLQKYGPPKIRKQITVKTVH